MQVIYWTGQRDIDASCVTYALRPAFEQPWPVALPRAPFGSPLNLPSTINRVNSEGEVRCRRRRAFATDLGGTRGCDRNDVLECSDPRQLAVAKLEGQTS